MSPEDLRRGLGNAPLPDPERQWQQIRARLAQPAQPAQRRVHTGLALAAGFAALVLGVSGGVIFQFRAPAQWEVVSREGAISADALRDDQWLETDSVSSARVKVGRIGSVSLGPESRARLVRGAWNAHRMELERGRIDAVIAAPPRLFFVQTPTALATDLGCAYSLEVENDGSSTLHVTVGWVELSHEGQRSIVPAGLRASVSRDGVPGVPHVPALALEELSKLNDLGAILDALSALDAAQPESIRRQTSGITLWHLLSRVDASERARVAAALRSRAPLPEGVTMEGILALDRQMLDRWREALHPMWGEEPAPAWVAAAQRIWLWVMD